MRRRQLYILVAVFFLLVACSKKGGETISDQALPRDEVDKAVEQEVEEDMEETEEIEEELIEPLYQLNAVWAFEPIADANPKAVLITIDDAPDQYALEMAKTLKELNAPAIFFVNGHFINTEEQQENLREIYDMGFAIGNHTKTHANLKQIPEEQQKEEIMMVSNTVEAVTGERPKFFRAPYGVNTDFSKVVVEEEGMLLMNWSYGYDWEKQYMNAEALADIMVNTDLLRDGANLLMHDRKWTADALKEIIEGLREKGYELIDPAAIKGIEGEY